MRRVRRLFLRWLRPHRLTEQWKLLFVLMVFISVVLWSVLSSPQQIISGCGCSRPYLWPPNSSIAPLNSTCSDPATFYHRNQNVISFSLHLKAHRRHKQQPLYVEGLQLNIEAARKLYPEFTLRIYTDHQLLSPKDPFCSLLCKNSHVFWCNVREVPSLRKIYPALLAPKRLMVWRFLPLGDPTVDVFLSRDLDSVVTPREEAAVRDWLQLRPHVGIHVMRDTDSHTALMLGGMWGARNGWVENVTQLQRDIILESRMIRPGTTDQDLLGMTVYARRAPEILAHASFYCVTDARWGVQWRAFPTRRLGPEPGGGFKDFVGNPGLGKEVYQAFPTCPPECRPLQVNEDWKYC